jgi:hypothetical protein
MIKIRTKKKFENEEKKKLVAVGIEKHCDKNYDCDSMQMRFVAEICHQDKSRKASGKSLR